MHATQDFLADLSRVAAMSAVLPRAGPLVLRRRWEDETRERARHSQAANAPLVIRGGAVVDTRTGQVLHLLRPGTLLLDQNS